MRAVTIALVLVASGCVAHGGAFVGVRASGRISYGWQAGAGTVLEPVIGQSYVDRRAFSYAALHGWWPARFREGEQARPYDLSETQVGMSLGGGSGPHGGGFVFGFDTAQYLAKGGGDEPGYTGAAALLGVRLIDDEAELYLGAELRYADYSGLDSGD